jgi:hypothetical protein
MVTPYPTSSTLAIDHPNCGAAYGQTGCLVTGRLDVGGGDTQNTVLGEADSGQTWWFETSTSHNGTIQGGIRFSPPIPKFNLEQTAGKTASGAFTFDAGDGTYELTCGGRKTMTVGGKRVGVLSVSGSVTWNVSRAPTPYRVRVDIQEEDYAPSLGLDVFDHTVTTPTSPSGDITYSVDDLAMQLMSANPA